MFLLQFPPTKDDLIIYGIILFFIGLFIYKYIQKRRKQIEEESYTPHRIVSLKNTTDAGNNSDSDEETMTPIEELAEDIDMYLPLLKVKLGIPLAGVCLAKNAVEAEEQYRNAESGSEEEYLALLKWIELEDNIENCGEMYDCAEDYDGSTEDLAVARWNVLALENANTVSSQEDLENAFSNSASGSEAEKIILKKLLLIYQNPE